MSRQYDVAVVGAGIVGLGAAYAAVRRGLSVVVLERGDRVVGATVRNFGHLCIGAQTGQARLFADASRELWLSLARDAGFWLRESGTLVVARHEDEQELLTAAAQDGGIQLLDHDEITRRAPVDSRVAIGGAWIEPDLQTHPREAAAAIIAYLERRGVEFRWRTSVGAVGSNLVRSSRGDIYADIVVVAVNHDVDQVYPELAERMGIVRCTLDMLRAQVDLARPLDAPLLTGWSLARYGRFAALPEAASLAERLRREHPRLSALDLNQMYTQLPDGSVIIGDTHHREITPPPFQSEAAADALLAEAAALFGTRLPRVIERWQGVYAAAPQDFLIAQPDARVFVLAATTGIGMTTGLGLAETVLAPLLGEPIARPNHTPRGVTHFSTSHASHAALKGAS